MPASWPEPEAVLYTTTPSRSAASARGTFSFPAPSPSVPTNGSEAPFRTS